MIKHALKYRFGQLCNMKIAYRQNRPYLPGMPMSFNARCPHCGMQESGGHILGGCRNAIFKARYQVYQQTRRSHTEGTQGNHGEIGKDGESLLKYSPAQICNAPPNTNRATHVQSNAASEQCFCRADQEHQAEF